MRALFTYGADVPMARVISEHRRWLWPVGIVLAINVIVLIAVVMPLRQSVESGATRAEQSAQALRAAMNDLRDAEATRDGQAQAATDLDRFYAEVLPTNETAARRITHLKMSQLARAHGVDFRSSALTSETLRDSTLTRLHVNYSLTGDWDDIRQMIYEIETGPDFMVIDNVRLDEGQDASSLSLALEMSTYFRAGSGSGNGR